MYCFEFEFELGFREAKREREMLEPKRVGRRFRILAFSLTLLLLYLMVTSSQRSFGSEGDFDFKVVSATSE